MHCYLSTTCLISAYLSFKILCLTYMLSLDYSGQEITRQPKANKKKICYFFQENTVDNIICKMSCVLNVWMWRQRAPGKPAPRAHPAKYQIRWFRSICNKNHRWNSIELSTSVSSGTVVWVGDYAQTTKTSVRYILRESPSITADSMLAPSQWETALLNNDVSHGLGASIESAP